MKKKKLSEFDAAMQSRRRNEPEGSSVAPTQSRLAFIF
jgi:hypothetical protein